MSCGVEAKSKRNRRPRNLYVNQIYTMKRFVLLVCFCTLGSLIHAQEDSLGIVAKFEAAKASLTLLSNQNRLIPIDQLENGPIALVGIGLTAGCNLQATLQKYTQLDSYPAPNVFSEAEAAQWIKENLSGYQAIVLGINDYDFAGVAPYTTHRFVIQQLLKQTNLITVVFGGDQVFTVLPELATKSPALLISPYTPYSHSLAAQVIMGGIPIESRLNSPIPGTRFEAGDGISVAGLNRLRFAPPETVNMDGKLLQDSIRQIVQQGIAAQAFPGAQVLVIKDGQVVYHETFGYQTYDSITPIKKQDLFDYASLTKITSALPALMQLHGVGKFDLDKTLANYMPYFKNSNKGDITFRSMLAHNAQLRPWIPYWRSAIKGNKKYPWQKKWDNDNYNNLKFKPKTFNLDSTENYTIRVTNQLWLHKDYKKKRIYKAIKKSPLNDKPGYVYSGLLFYLLPELVSNLSGEAYESYLKKNIYEPIGAYTITFNPYLHYPKERIIPTENDTFFRLTQLQGSVHDEGAAMMAGVSANAGLFSTAIDLGKLMYTYMNDGMFGNQQILPRSSVLEFRRCQYCPEGNRRGIGFDKPLIKYSENLSSISKEASPESFGHSGYTGTFAWADPVEDLIFIFFSNRVYPTRDNRKIYQMGIRPRIHQVLYDAMK